MERLITKRRSNMEKIHTQYPVQLKMLNPIRDMHSFVIYIYIHIYIYIYIFVCVNHSVLSNSVIP